MFDGEAFGRDIVSAVKAHMASEMAPLLARIAMLESRAALPAQIGERGPAGPPGEAGPKGERGEAGPPGANGQNGADGASVTVADVAPLVAAEVARAVAAAPPVEPKEIDTGLIRRMVAEAVAQIPTPKDGAPGRDADPVGDEQIAAAVSTYLTANPPPAGPRGEPGPVGPQGPEGPAGPQGRAGDAGNAAPAPTQAEIVSAILSVPDAIGEAVAKHLTANPPPAGPVGPQGERGAQGERGEKGDDGQPGAAGAPGEHGAAGAPGKLPIAKAWAEGVHYAGEVVTHDGATWQATRDTGRAPGHEDWTCLARSGRDGADGRSFTVRGTYDGAANYSGLDVVALGGSAFVARRDNPGACPGEGWQAIAMRGKAGPPAERGPAGPQGMKGVAGPPVLAMDVDGEGMLTLTNADGSSVVCDLYPVLAKLAR